MGLLDFFKPIPSWTPEEVRKFLDQKRPEEYNLVDVRQPREYEKEHLPGARLIPVSQLPARLEELDPAKPTVTY